MDSTKVIASLIADFIIILLSSVSCKLIWLWLAVNINIKNPSLFSWLLLLVLWAIFMLAASTIYSFMSNILLAFFGKNSFTHPEKKL